MDTFCCSATYFLLSVWHIRLIVWLSSFSQSAWVIPIHVGSTLLSSTMPNSYFPMKIARIWNFHIWKFFPLIHSILPNSLLFEFSMINTYQQNTFKLINKLMNKHNLLKDRWAHNLKASTIYRQTCAWLHINK